METMNFIAQLLRDEHYKHILLLVNPKIKARLLDDWEQQVANDHTFSELFSVTSVLQNAQDAQVCIASVFDIQMQIGVDRKQPFFKLFDAVLLGDDVSTHHGPAWHQIVGIFTLLDTRVLNVRSVVSEEHA